MTTHNKEEIRIERTHDLELYLNENRYEEPKELFKFITDYLIEVKGLKYFEDLQLCDFGCAAGEFLYHLDTCFPKSKLMGVDILEELIFKANKFVPRASFTVGSILESNLIESNRYKFFNRCSLNFR
jgi:tRNA G46 methylase TrmB